MRRGFTAIARVTALAVLGFVLAGVATRVSAQQKLDRTVLPLAEPPTYSELDARKAKPPKEAQKYHLLPINKITLEVQ